MLRVDLAPVACPALPCPLPCHSAMAHGHAPLSNHTVRHICCGAQPCCPNLLRHRSGETINRHTHVITQAINCCRRLELLLLLRADCNRFFSQLCPAVGPGCCGLGKLSAPRVAAPPHSPVWLLRPSFMDHVAAQLCWKPALLLFNRVASGKCTALRFQVLCAAESRLPRHIWHSVCRGISKVARVVS